MLVAASKRGPTARLAEPGAAGLEDIAAVSGDVPHRRISTAATDCSSSSISKSGYRPSRRAFDAAFRWSPAATPADLYAPVVTESRGRSGARCWRSEALGGFADPLGQRLRVDRGFGIPDELAVSRAGASRRRASPEVAVVVAWRGVCSDAVMPGRRAASGRSPRPRARS